MSERQNALGQPIGAALPDWTARPLPPRSPMIGRLCRIEPINSARHAAELHDAYQQDREGRNWTYLGYGPFDSLGAWSAWMERTCRGSDPLFHAIIDGATGRAVGMASYLRLDPGAGVIEVGHIHYSPLLQRRTAATEAMYLMMRRVFEELGYRRYEWKCDALNQPSRHAARRLGFSFEGVFRQATIYKGRNRDTAWYAIIDRDWPALAEAYERWLDPGNFDARGRQRLHLADLTRPTIARSVLEA
jgi:RimJ/RimL family protein N-acetyltransferase